MARWIAVAMLGVCLNAGATSYYVSNGVADAGARECADVQSGGHDLFAAWGDLEGAVDSAIIGNERKFHQV